MTFVTSVDSESTFCRCAASRRSAVEQTALQHNTEINLTAL